MSRHPVRRTALAIFRAPLLIAVATLTGLVAGLLGDGVRDWIAWAGIGAPVAAIIWALTRRKEPNAPRT